MPPILSNNTNYCAGKLLPPGMNICCLKGYFSDGINGCKICHGNIFGTTNYQKCCGFNQIYNQTSDICSTCSGIVDKYGSICCPTGSYITYNINGTISC